MSCTASCGRSETVQPLSHFRQTTAGGSRRTGLRCRSAPNPSDADRRRPVHASRGPPVHAIRGFAAAGRHCGKYPGIRAAQRQFHHCWAAGLNRERPAVSPPCVWRGRNLRCRPAPSDGRHARRSHYACHRGPALCPFDAPKTTGFWRRPEVFLRPAPRQCYPAREIPDKNIR